MNTTRYSLVSDEDGHHYIIPADKKEEWREHLDKIYHQGEYPDDPQWAERIDCPERITFENWKED